MSDLIKYDRKYAPQPTGLQNTGVICYFNSLLQSMISCTSLNQTVLGLARPNALAQRYAEMVRAMTAPTDARDTAAGRGNLQGWSAIIWAEFMKALVARKRQDRIAFGAGQEDSSEALVLLLEMMECPQIDRLFEHRFRVTITCGHCNRACSVSHDEGLTVEMNEQEARAQSAERYLLGHASAIDESFVCPLCRERGRKSMTRRAVMVPEIIIVQYKKYDSKWTADAPQTLRVPGHAGDIVYNQIAQIEHAGTPQAGHYWARALRADGKVYMLNDSSCSPGVWASTPETYMVWYHVV